MVPEPNYPTAQKTSLVPFVLTIGTVKLIISTKTLLNIAGDTSRRMWSGSWTYKSVRQRCGFSPHNMSAALWTTQLRSLWVTYHLSISLKATLSIFVSFSTFSSRILSMSPVWTTKNIMDRLEARNCPSFVDGWSVLPGMSDTDLHARSSLMTPRRLSVVLDYVWHQTPKTK